MEPWTFQWNHEDRKRTHLYFTVISTPLVRLIILVIPRLLMLTKRWPSRRGITPWITGTAGWVGGGLVGLGFDEVDTSCWRCLKISSLIFSVFKRFVWASVFFTLKSERNSFTSTSPFRNFSATSWKRVQFVILIVIQWWWNGSYKGLRGGRRG